MRLRAQPHTMRRQLVNPGRSGPPVLLRDGVNPVQDRFYCASVALQPWRRFAAIEHDRHWSVALIGGAGRVVEHCACVSKRTTT